MNAPEPDKTRQTATATKRAPVREPKPPEEPHSGPASADAPPHEEPGYGHGV